MQPLDQLRLHDDARATAGQFAFGAFVYIDMPSGLPQQQAGE